MCCGRLVIGCVVMLIYELGWIFGVGLIIFSVGVIVFFGGVLRFVVRVVGLKCGV